MKSHIIAIDQGTTSCRAVLYNKRLEKIGIYQIEFQQHYPHTDWVEHDAEEIYQTQLNCIQKLLSQSKLTIKDIASVGITNQRETLVAWSKSTGKALSRAIVWQDKRTQNQCTELAKNTNIKNNIEQKTGLLINPYFSASKAQWLLENSPEVQNAFAQKDLALGTMDSWLIFKLTQGEHFVTDATNASRTLVFNIHTGNWDEELMEHWNLPKECFAKVLDCSDNFGTIKEPILKGVPILGVAGDQQASLIGHKALNKNDFKITYGTGCFALKNIGPLFEKAPPGLLTTLAWSLNGKRQYAFEGSVLIGGAAIQFLRDNLGIIKTAAESEELALSIKSNEGVYFVPAFGGLGSPYWDPGARGLFCGLSRGSDKRHFCRAALESVAYQSRDLLESIQSEKGSIFADGGACSNQFLMQFQSNILEQKLHVSSDSELTAQGVAYLCALKLNWIESLEVLKNVKSEKKEYSPKMNETLRQQNILGWEQAVQKCQNNNI
jgi:glycerol kinase